MGNNTDTIVGDIGNVIKKDIINRATVIGEKHGFPTDDVIKTYQAYLLFGLNDHNLGRFHDDSEGQASIREDALRRTEMFYSIYKPT